MFFFPKSNEKWWEMEMDYFNDLKLIRTSKKLLHRLLSSECCKIKTYKYFCKKVLFWEIFHVTQAIGFKCLDENCNKEFSTKLNCNKHEIQDWTRICQHNYCNTIWYCRKNINVEHQIVQQPKNIEKTLLSIKQSLCILLSWLWKVCLMRSTPMIRKVTLYYKESDISKGAI